MRQRSRIARRMRKETMIWKAVNYGSSEKSPPEHTGVAADPTPTSEGASSSQRIVPEESEYPRGIGLDPPPTAQVGPNRVPKGAAAASGSQRPQTRGDKQAMRRNMRAMPSLETMLAKTHIAADPEEPKEAFPRPPPPKPVSERASRPRPRARLTGPRIAKYVAIAFVEELERAHQVFQFRDHLRTCDSIKHDSNPDDLFYLFLGSDVVKNSFYLADDDDLFYAIKFYIFDLRAEQAGQVPKKIYDGFLFPNPMYYLIFRAREEGYVLRENLVAELHNLKKFAPMFYRDCLVCQERPVVRVELEARTVIVSNFSPEFSWKYIREFFSCCGHVENVEMQSLSEGPIARVTFKDVSGAEDALFYSGLRVSCLSKSMENSDYGRYVPLLVQRKWDKAARNAETVGAGELEDDISNKYAQALNKYNELRTYYSEYQAKKGVKASKTEAVWGDCQWMGLEAMANGGFTLGGQRL